VSFLPLTGLAAATSLEVIGRPVPKGEEPVADVRIVSGDYFRAMGVPLVKGRLFDERERREKVGAAVINETMARQLWPNEDPIGRRFVMSWDRPPVTDEVIGVVGDVLHEGLDARIRPMVYLTHPRTVYRALTVVVRAAGDPAALTSTVVDQVRQMEPDQPVANIRTMDEVAARSVGQRRVIMLLLGVFAGAALLLAAVGLYGMLAYVVVQRTREIGVRLALGASRGVVLRQVVGGALRLTATGLVVGLAGALALTRVMTTLLFQTTPTDALTLGAVAGGVILIALIASALPALQAARVDPVIALRAE
jgi:putative ABC transport system permease protein